MEIKKGSGTVMNSGLKMLVAELRRDGWGEKRKLHEEEEENDGYC